MLHKILDFIPKFWDTKGNKTNNTWPKDKAISKTRFGHDKDVRTIKRGILNIVNKLRVTVETVDNMHDQMAFYKKNKNKNARDEIHSNRGEECFNGLNVDDTGERRISKLKIYQVKFPKLKCQWIIIIIIINNKRTE